MKNNNIEEGRTNKRSCGFSPESPQRSRPGQSTDLFFSQPGRSSPDRRGGSCAGDGLGAAQMHTRRGGITQWERSVEKEKPPCPCASFSLVVFSSSVCVVRVRSHRAGEGIYWKLRRVFSVLPLDGTALAFGASCSWDGMYCRQKWLLLTPHGHERKLASWLHDGYHWQFAKPRPGQLGKPRPGQINIL